MAWRGPLILLSYQTHLPCYLTCESGNGWSISLWATATWKRCERCQSFQSHAAGLQMFNHCVFQTITFFLLVTNTTPWVCLTHWTCQLNLLLFLLILWIPARLPTIPVCATSACEVTHARLNIRRNSPLQHYIQTAELKATRHRTEKEGQQVDKPHCHFFGEFWGKRQLLHFKVWALVPFWERHNDEQSDPRCSAGPAGLCDYQWR